MRPAIKAIITKDFLPIERLARLHPDRRKAILSRSTTAQKSIVPLVQGVVDDVAANGDKALLKYTRKFDKTTLTPSRLIVNKSDIKRAYRTVLKANPELLPSIQSMIECVRGYHSGELTQLRSNQRRWKKNVRSAQWPAGTGLSVGQLRTPIERVGVYIPGGNAVLLTTAVMGITPAKVAGVPFIAVASPPSRNGDIDPQIIVAADMAGADVIIRAGGAQAIAAMAFGTATVPKVHKIIGPGNVFVAAAKSYVANSGVCAIDFPAGPSEVLIIADDSAVTEYVARDMLSQSEHDANASSVLVTTSKRLAKSVRNRIIAEFCGNATPSTAQLALSKYGAIILAESLARAVDFANEFAPEHLEIVIKRPESMLSRVRNAGGIFLGPYSPVAIGDYVCPNHILPTGGAAKFSSGISVDTFMKKPAVLEVPKSLIKTLNKLVETLSKAEGLYAQHGLSVKARADRK